MKYKVTLNNRVYEVEVEQGGVPVAGGDEPVGHGGGHGQDGAGQIGLVGHGGRPLSTKFCLSLHFTRNRGKGKVVDGVIFVRRPLWEKSGSGAKFLLTC